MRKLKFFSLLLACLLSVSLVTGCGQNSGTVSTPDDSAGVTEAPQTPPPSQPPVEPPAPAKPTAEISWDQASGYVGQNTTVGGRVVDTRFASSSNGSPTFLNIGLPYPNQDRFTIVIWGDSRGNFPSAPEDMYLGKEVIVSGYIETYKGVAEIEATSPSQITIVE